MKLNEALTAHTSLLAVWEGVIYTRGNSIRIKGLTQTTALAGASSVR